MGSQNDLRHRKPNTAVVPTDEGRKTDERLDKHESYVLFTFITRLKLKCFFCSYEFGGPVGVTAMMIGFPILMYYLWICLWFYDGQIVYPSSLDDVQPFLWRMWEHVKVVSISTPSLGYLVLIEY